jgi:hypothetical protein
MRDELLPRFKKEDMPPLPPAPTETPATPTKPKPKPPTRRQRPVKSN